MEEDIRAVRAALDAASLRGGEITLIGHGQSGDCVARVAGAVPLIVKLASGDNAGALAQEIAAMRWLGGRVRTAEVVWSGPCDRGLAMIAEALPGEAVSHVPPEHAARALGDAAAALAGLHALDIAGCPFDARLDSKLARAEANVAAGLVDEDDFDAERLGRSARDLLDEVLARRPASEDLVAAHGDASLPNFLWSPGAPVGLIDLGRFGVADRWQDLALFLWSAEHNHPHVDARAILRERYPIDELDEELVAYYRLLDEFF